jgi:hypothetical protein
MEQARNCALCVASPSNDSINFSKFILQGIAQAQNVQLVQIKKNRKGQTVFVPVK